MSSLSATTMSAARHRSSRGRSTSSLDPQVRSVSFLLIVAVLVLWRSDVASAEDNCSDQRFVDELSGVNGWKDLYAFYQHNLKKCPDDGFYAEGYSQSVTDLLAKRWSDLSTLRSLSTLDPGFLDFVLKHVDSTADRRELKHIVTSARAHCPTDATSLCSAIARRAKSGLAAQ